MNDAVPIDEQEAAANDQGIDDGGMDGQLCFDANPFPTSKDGDEVEGTLRGKLTEKDGKFYILPNSVNGREVSNEGSEDPVEEAAETPAEEDAENANEPKVVSGVEAAGSKLTDALKEYNKAPRKF